MSTDNPLEHWQNVYSTKRVDQVGWYTAHLHISLDWIDDLKLKPDDAIIDVGGGASTLVDDLLSKDYRSLCVLDISEQALVVVKQRLGDRAELVTWLQGDVTEVDLPDRNFELWHDRAVFHFLVEPVQRQKYINKILKTLKPGGHLLMGVFDLPAPPQCSGLPVQRYSIESLEATLGEDLKLRRHQKDVHHTPSGLAQAYVYGLFERLG
jgi:ubiquinone/menaquinone biosynthesis C-methylase UbiE